ncbi:MAG: SDR family NAD(P)-dependent oxidoreductase [Myxococcales bacterium]|nr:SDR family NAD(P)-dependent oxidoreductase [Myxococcales bacterium]
MTESATAETARRQWAVVLGASVGSGAAIARAVASDPGLNVFSVHRGHHPEAAAEVQRDIGELGRRTHFRVGDAASAEAAAAGAAELAEVAGPKSVQLFVHSLASASLGRLTGADRLSPRHMSKTFDVMAHSFVYWVQELVGRDLLAPGARILGLTNPLDESLVLQCGLIAATKGALEGYARALALELGPKGYRVNLLKFSTVITPAVAAVYGKERLEAITRAHERFMPARRMCTVEEVGSVVSLLAGPSAEYFNGATIDFSGGMMLGAIDALLRDPSSA